jgi:hypothetical protein
MSAADLRRKGIYPMHKHAKIVLLPALLPMLAVVALATPASAAAVHQQRPAILTPHFTAVKASTVRTGVVTGTQTNTYVTTKGTDVGTCPKVAPCATISYAESQTAVNGTIHVADGTYYHQSAELTQPVHLLGASESKVIIDGTNVDYTSYGYYGLIAIDNTSGTAGTITISNLTVRHAYITSNEASADQVPVDIANYESATGNGAAGGAGDTVKVNAVTLGPVQNPSQYDGFGYYSLNAQSTNLVFSDYATGLYAGYFAEGSAASGNKSKFTYDTAKKLAGFTDTSTNPSTYYPAVGVYALADTEGTLTIAANHDSFSGYNGWGIVGESGYSQSNCTNNVCTGSLSINTNYNSFNLLAAPASGVAAIAAYAATNDQLTGVFSHSSGTVASPDVPVLVQNDGGTVTVTDSYNTIKVTH